MAGTIAPQTYLWTAESMGTLRRERILAGPRGEALQLGLDGRVRAGGATSHVIRARWRRCSAIYTLRDRRGALEAVAVPMGGALGFRIAARGLGRLKLAGRSRLGDRRLVLTHGVRDVLFADATGGLLRRPDRLESVLDFEPGFVAFIDHLARVLRREANAAMIAIMAAG